MRINEIDSKTEIYTPYGNGYHNSPSSYILDLVKSDRDVEEIRQILHKNKEVLLRDIASNVTLVFRNNEYAANLLLELQFAISELASYGIRLLWLDFKTILLSGLSTVLDQQIPKYRTFDTALDIMLDNTPDKVRNRITPDIIKMGLERNKAAIIDNLSNNLADKLYISVMRCISTLYAKYNIRWPELQRIINELNNPSQKDTILRSLLIRVKNELTDANGYDDYDTHSLIDYDHDASASDILLYVRVLKIDWPELGVIKKSIDARPTISEAKNSTVNDVKYNLNEFYPHEYIKYISARFKKNDDVIRNLNNSKAELIKGVARDLRSMFKNLSFSAASVRELIDAIKLLRRRGITLDWLDINNLAIDAMSSVLKRNMALTGINDAINDTLNGVTTHVASTIATPAIIAAALTQIKGDVIASLEHSFSDDKYVSMLRCIHLLHTGYHLMWPELDTLTNKLNNSNIKNRLIKSILISVRDANNEYADDNESLASMNDWSFDDKPIDVIKYLHDAKINWPELDIIKNSISIVSHGK
jgi:hypothetical protein